MLRATIRAYDGLTLTINADTDSLEGDMLIKVWLALHEGKAWFEQKGKTLIIRVPGEV